VQTHFDILIIGGGAAGLTVAAQLADRVGGSAIGIIEPSARHYYQPLWTLVGGGVFPREVTERDEAEFIPPGATWIRDGVVTFDPAQRAVTTEGERVVTYDQLVVAPGVQLDWG
jgi:sulfide:quinone oxidoreductase